MSGAAPVRLPLSDRQADALAKLLRYGELIDDDDLAAIREVAGKLDTLREQ